MPRRREGAKGRRKNVVVFLDANISLGMAFYLSDLRRYAHWISLDSLERALERGDGGRGRHYTKAQRRRIRDFFDRTGDQNLFDQEGPPPHKMKDNQLLSYIVRLMEEVYSSRPLYLFYTHDKKFLTQDLLKSHPNLSSFDKKSVPPDLLENYPHLSLLTDGGKLVYVALDTPDKRGKIREVAGAIRKDFMERLDEIMWG